MRTRRIATLAILSTLSFVGRIAFTFLPNVQPTTVIIMLVALVYGFKDGVIVATLSMIISNLYLGFGLWTIPQIVTYVAIVGFVSLYSRRNVNVLSFSILAMGMGYVYGFLISALNIPMFGYGYFIVYYLNGFSFDTAHAIGNLIFGFILYPALKTILTKNYNKIYRGKHNEN